MPCTGARISVQSAILPLTIGIEHHYFINSLEASHTERLGLFLAQAHKANEIYHSPNNFGGFLDKQVTGEGYFWQLCCEPEEGQ